MSCTGDTASQLMACVDSGQFRRQLEFIAQLRPPGSAHHDAVRQLCVDQFEAFGFEVDEFVSFGHSQGVSVVGVRAGTTQVDEWVVLGAHYDHLEGCVGADDNATGVSAVLEAARVLSTRDHARTLVVACWDQEELGLLGSMAWVANAASEGRNIVQGVSLDMLGYRDSTPGSQSMPPGFELIFPELAERLSANESRGDFIASFGDSGSGAFIRAYEARGAEVSLPVYSISLPIWVIQSPFGAVFARSDHASFWASGYSGVAIGDTANFRSPYYHCLGGPDTMEHVDVEFAEMAARATVGALVDVLNPSTSSP